MQDGTDYLADTATAKKLRRKPDDPENLGI